MTNEIQKEIIGLPKLPHNLSPSLAFYDGNRIIVTASNETTVFMFTWDGATALWEKMEAFIRYD